MNAAARMLVWCGSSLKDLQAMPPEAQRSIGFVLRKAQQGMRDEAMKPLTGRREFRGAKVLQITERHDGDTYRCVFTVEFAEAIYVLHAFQKKAKHGIATPQSEIDVIVERLQTVRERRGS
jgi:phage-related protein